MAIVKPMAGILMALALAPVAEAALVPPGCLGVALTLGQAPERNASAHSVLNNAIDSYRRGEYEKAAVLLHRAQVNQADLTPDEVNDLNTHLRHNNQALKARADGDSQLRLAEAALNKGDKARAAGILKAQSVNQYLTAANQQLAKKLSARLRTGTTGAVTEEGPELVNSAESSNTPAKIKLREARAQLDKGKFQEATDMALEAEKLGGVYMVGEDTPTQVLEDVDKVRRGGVVKKQTPVKQAPVPTPAVKPDARALLVSARAALQKGDLDRADELTAEAEKAAALARGVIPSWLHPWSDTPAKVRRDIQTARAKEAAAKAREAAAQAAQAAQAALAAQNSKSKDPEKTVPAAGNPTGDKEPKTVETKPSSSPFQTIKGFFVRGNPQPKTEVTVAKPTEKGEDKKDDKKDDKGKDVVQANVAAPTGGTGAQPPVAPAPATSAEKAAAARLLIAEGRKAMQEGKLAVAEAKADKARALKPDLRWWDDNPDKLWADVQKRKALVAKKKPVQPESKTNPPATTVATADKDKEKPLTPAEARKVVRQGRELFVQGKIDDAEKLGRQAANVPTRWGLFEDSPEKLRIDIQNARRKHDQEASVKLLGEARTLFARGDLKEAKAKAYLAQKLHGPYSWWELGDRPLRLVSEIDVSELKTRKHERPQGLSGSEDKKTPVTGGDNLVSTRPAPKKDEPTVTGLTPEQRAARVQEYLAEARTQLGKKNLVLAKQFADKVNQLGAGWDYSAQGPPPWRDSLFVLMRDLDQASYPTSGLVPPTGTPLVADRAPVNGPVRQQVAYDLAKQKAKMLVIEARGLQARGRLVEAREKALEAQRTSSAFGPDEDRPEIVLLHLAGLCSQKIELLLKQAEDLVHAGAGNPVQMRQAETNLFTAKELANGFAMDTNRVEHKIAWLQNVQDNMQAKGPPPLVDPQPLPPQPSPVGVVKAVQKETIKGPDALTMKQQGEELLNKSRLELKAGQSNQARRFAETVFLGNFGMRKEAEDMLRTIDGEDFKQSILEANRTADAGFNAFKRHDYAHSYRILAALDTRQLSAPKQAHLREIMTTPEMQNASQSVKAPAPTVVVQKNEGPPNLHPLNGDGKASVTDEAMPNFNPPKDDDLLAKAAGMQEIKFQALHTESRNVQKKALELFKAGDTAQAVEMLREFSKNLGSSDLETARVDLLRRPVEDRLQKLTMLKAQGEFERSQKGQRNHASAQMSKLAQAEKLKQDQVATLMKRYHTLYKEGKYSEALATAQQVLEVDPDNVAASAGLQIAKTKGRLKDFHEISDEKEEYGLRALNDSDRTGPSVVDDPMKFDHKIWDRGKMRRTYPNGIQSMVRSQKERDIERRLLTPITLSFKNTPLNEVVDVLYERTGINLVLDKRALEDANIGLDKQLDFRVDGISLKSALNLLLHQAQLTYVVRDEVLVITTEDNAKGKNKRVTYPVADLVVPVENHELPASANIKNFLDKQLNGGIANPYAASPYPGPNAMSSGSPVSKESSGTFVPPGSAGQGGGAQVKYNGPGHTIEDTLIKLITSTIAPGTWSEVGGAGTIQYFPLGMALIVNQTQDLQEQIADLLAALRRLQDLEVAIEMRLVSVSESFFERIGLDFNVNIVNNNQKFDNNLLNGQFQPFGFINKFTPSGFVSGLTPAGTLTQDLGIPIKNNSFNLTTPPFGYPGLISGDGGLSLGLAFLSDIQVFMFMEAAQGDRRFNIMQAPKLTMFNGQSATLTVQDYQFFLTDVQPGFTPSGQIYFIPRNVPVPLGVSLTVQPVVSGDRRFVRMNLAPQLTNLTNANVPITLGPQAGQGFPVPTLPIQIPVPGVFEGNVQSPNQGGLFQIFLQQPTTTTISIQTTVSVPDGGTVLLGGLKTLSEGRSEFGPPILSKIPYINRLFKNVGYGREAQSLLIMVTPRIIINEEEELRQTGFDRNAAGQ